MEKYDRNLEKRVWERIREETPREPDLRNLPALIADEAAAAALYRSLARRVLPRHRDTMLHMAREEQAHRDALMGMYYLTTGRRAAVQVPVPGQSPLEAALRRSYAGELKSIAAYEARSEDPEYGAAFARMAQEEGDHSRWILEILGDLGKV